MTEILSGGAGCQGRNRAEPQPPMLWLSATPPRRGHAMASAAAPALNNGLYLDAGTTRGPYFVPFRSSWTCAAFTVVVPDVRIGSVNPRTVRARVVRAWLRAVRSS